METPCPANTEQWINLCEYTVTEIILVLVGTVLWNVAYGIIIYKSFKNRYVEMPYLAGASNFAWEFVWGFLVVTNMGKLFVWGLQIWFLMDILIFYLIFRYGNKQFEYITKIAYFIPVFLGVFLFWIPVFYYFYTEGYDTPMGATSAYLITIIMAALYIHHFLSAKNKSFFSVWVGWCELIGNTCMSVFVVMHYPTMRFLQLLTLAVFFLNLAYVIVHYRYAHHKTRQATALSDIPLPITV